MPDIETSPPGAAMMLSGYSTRDTSWMMRDWQECAIDPAWITEGAPHALISHIANDGVISAGYWHCTQGAFTWRYAVDETIVFLSGIAVIDGQRHEAGSTASFARGTTAEWVVIEAVTKMYVIQKPKSVARRVFGRLSRAVFA
jgi:uncharacterized cupin superfamily protein